MCACKFSLESNACARRKEHIKMLKWKRIQGRQGHGFSVIIGELRGYERKIDALRLLRAFQ